MGFSPNRIEAALKNAASDSLEDCIQWLEENEAKFEASEKFHQQLNADTSTAASGDHSGEPAESSADGAAASETEPPKPLTEEEKAAKLELLRQKAAIRKAEQAKKDLEEQKKNEVIRRKHDQESIRVKEELKKKEAMQAAARRRQEAKEDALAKKRIKDLIEADKRERLEKKQQLSSNPPPSLSSSSSSPSNAPTSSSTTSQPKPKPVYTESKLRFRIQGIASAQPNLMKTFPIDATLGSVAETLATELAIPANSIVLTTTFPTRTLTSADFSLTLKQADLVNASVILKQA
ncbi:hypothetical protein AWJ20_4629 [Sugiyamaella lignohabitans]|uniref:UBA domain-containing protein n=1 Tax=Sugiyamaella lignohabitans TaxID=796027 RepID=A0A167E615_9ASCO|nr:uncharacterized protein AWJ20_4629 [Sugiyamaella lignohabitans]ANB13686.1 hypothetical protein AWJ20_4629 [Sugiyamaella lignohabitans]